jgi:hypothetical protein
MRTLRALRVLIAAGIVGAVGLLLATALPAQGPFRNIGQSLLFTFPSPFLRFAGAMTLDSSSSAATSGLKLKAQQLSTPLPTSGTQASCTSAAGCQAATVTGSDSGLAVTLGASPTGATFTVTFGGTWGAAPSCVVSPASSAAGVPQQVLTTTTTVQVLTASALGASAKYSILCWGVS